MTFKIKKKRKILVVKSRTKNLENWKFIWNYKHATQLIYAGVVLQIK